MDVPNIKRIDMKFCGINDDGTVKLQDDAGESCSVQIKKGAAELKAEIERRAGGSFSVLG